MRSIDDVMKMVTWLFLEVLSGVKLVTGNVNLYTCHKTDIWTKQIGERTVYNLQTTFFFHVDKIIDQPHLSKRIPSVSFKFISCQKICRYYVEMSNCNLCITRCFKFQVEGYRSVPLKFESELLYLVKKKSNPFWRY